MDEIRANVTKFFTKHFQERVNFKPYLHEVSFLILYVYETNYFSTRFNSLEVDLAVAGLDGSKIHVSDELNFEFYKKF